jgi:hypothetical protein
MIERGFERVLWTSRLAVLLAVIVSVLPSMTMLIVATVDAARLIGTVGGFSDRD